MSNIQGLETLSNLRSILTLKTAELNELVAQLELTNQAIINVEQTTTQTEAILKDMGIVADDRLLMEAHASLDRAIKSASSLYKPQEQQDAVSTQCLFVYIYIHILIYLSIYLSSDNA